MFFIASKVMFFIVRPSDLALIVAGLAALAALLRSTAWARRLSVATFLIFLVFGFSGLSNALLYALESRFPHVELDGSQKVDGILVLGGGSDAELSTVLGHPILYPVAERFTEAARLARMFPKARVAFSGGTGNLDEMSPPEAKVAKEILAQLGIEPERITLEEASRNTIENARFSLEVVKPQPSENWVLITSGFHMPRSVGIFRRIGWPGLIPFKVGERADSRLWWTAHQPPGEVLTQLDLAVKEYIGLVAYKLADYTDAWFPAP